MTNKQNWMQSWLIVRNSLYLIRKFSFLNERVFFFRITWFKSRHITKTRIFCVNTIWSQWLWFFSKKRISKRWKKKKRFWCERWISKWIIIFQIFLFVFIFFICLLFCIDNWSEFQYMKHVDRFHWFEFDKTLKSQIIHLFIQTSLRSQLSDNFRFFRLSFIFCFLSIQLFVSLTSQINSFVKFRYRNDDQIQKQMLSFRIVMCLNDFESINFSNWFRTFAIRQLTQSRENQQQHLSWFAWSFVDSFTQ